MPTATSYYTQRTVTTTSTSSRAMPKYDSETLRQSPPVPAIRTKAVSVHEMSKMLDDVKADQSRKVVLDTLAALVTDVNATAEILRSRSSSRTNLADESRILSQLSDDDFNTRPRTQTPRSPITFAAEFRSKPLDVYLCSFAFDNVADGGVVDSDSDASYTKQKSRYEQDKGTTYSPVEIEYRLRLHTPIDGVYAPQQMTAPVPAPRKKLLMHDRTPSLERVYKDFDIDTPRARSMSRPRSETPSSRKLIVLEEPKPNDAPICAACNSPIYGACVTALAPNSKRAQKYHPPHFVCNYCLKPLNLKGTYREHERKPYCHECFYRLFSGHVYVTENKLSLST